MTTFPERSSRIAASPRFSSARVLAFGLTLLGAATLEPQAKAQSMAQTTEPPTAAPASATEPAPSLSEPAPVAVEPAAGVAEPAAVATSFARPVRPVVGLTVSLGFRTDLVRSTGLDPFSLQDDLTQSALAIAYGFTPSGGLGLALGLEWNHGESSARARGADATLTIDRLSLGIEGRLSLAKQLVAFARLAPGLLRDHAVINDASAPPDAYESQGPAVLQQTSWVAAGDISGGLALRLANLKGFAGPVFGLWLVAEGGYGYAASHNLVLSPHVDTQPARVDEPVHLGKLAFSGAFLRARLALSF